MLRVPIEQTKPGMILARSVADPTKPEHVLLKAGFELDEHHIARLRSFRIPRIWVNYPGLNFLDEMLDPELVSQQQSLYGSLKKQFNKVQQSNQGLDNIDYTKYVLQMRQFFQRLLAQKQTTSLFITELQGLSDDIFLHGTIVASMALLLGLRLENYLVRSRPNLSLTAATDLTYLGVGCLLHDVGKIFLPPELQNFTITASDMGSPLWQQHTEKGFEMIKAGLDPTAGQIIINHHQHYDGSGFPPRKALPGIDKPVVALKGSEIHVFCRIATLADRFEGFRHLPDNTVAPIVVALKRIQNPGYVKWFDPIIYKTFIESMPAFSPGEQVTLNNGQHVVVTEINENAPCRPVVRPVDINLAINCPPSPVQSQQNTQKPPVNPPNNQQQNQQATRQDTPPNTQQLNQQEKSDGTTQSSNNNDKQADNDKSNPEENRTNEDINLAIHPELFIARVGNFDVTPYLY